MCRVVGVFDVDDLSRKRKLAQSLILAQLSDIHNAVYVTCFGNLTFGFIVIFGYAHSIFSPAHPDIIDVEELIERTFEVEYIILTHSSGNCQKHNKNRGDYANLIVCLIVC